MLERLWWTFWENMHLKWQKSVERSIETSVQCASKKSFSAYSRNRSSRWLSDHKLPLLTFCYNFLARHTRAEGHVTFLCHHQKLIRRRFTHIINVMPVCSLVSALDRTQGQEWRTWTVCWVNLLHFSILCGGDKGEHHFVWEQSVA